VGLVLLFTIRPRNTHLASGTGFPKRVEIGYENASGLASPTWPLEQGSLRG
jgi:hypothetical protein